MKKKYVLINSRDLDKCELRLAFYRKGAKIICDLSECVVIDFVKKYLVKDDIMPLPKEFKIDEDVKEYVVNKYLLDV